MEINKELKQVFKDNNVNYGDGVIYLLAKHFNLVCEQFTNEFKASVDNIGIISDSLTGLSWNIPLFEGEEVAFNWIRTEYIPMFKAKNSDKGGKVRESTKRMKDLFAKNPEIRKLDVINATRLYLSRTNSKYIRLPHYFITKGKGVDKIEELLDWLNKLKEIEKSSSNRESKTNTMK